MPNSRGNTVKAKIVSSLARMASRLPMPVLYGFSSAIASALSGLKLYRYKVVDGNLRKAMPDLTDSERKRIIKGFYRHLSDSIVETLKLMTISDEDLRKKVEFHGSELINAEIEAGHDIIIYLGHYGNWEVVPTISWTLPKNDNIVFGQIFRPLRDPMSAAIMEQIRSRFGVTNIPQKQAFRTLLRIKNDGKQSVTGFIADQRPNSKALNHWTEFFGLDTPFAAGGEEIGRRLHAKYFYLDVTQPKRGHTSITFIPIEPIEGEEYPYTVAYLRLLEQSIRRDPALWLWSHKRWKHQRK